MTETPDEASSALVSQLFNSGRAATAISGPWFLSQIDRGVPYAVAPMPMSLSGRDCSRATMPQPAVRRTAKRPRR